MKSTLFILICCIMLLPGSLINADPHRRNLNAVHMVVADYSKTGGGGSPAVSPDGKLLAFIPVTKSVGETDIWVLDGWKAGSTNKIQPWFIDYDANLQPDTTNNVGRNMDWSQDGKKLVFRGSYGDLYIAEDIDAVTKKAASVRIIARGKAKAGYDWALVMMQPRLSPDGKKVAFIRSYAKKSHDFIEYPTDVCVVDVETGNEILVADDGIAAAQIWEQPWSPDGKYLTYASGKFEYNQGDYDSFRFNMRAYKSLCHSYQKISNHATHVNIVSVDGKQKWSIGPDANCTIPSWSWATNRIAFSAQQHYEFNYSEDLVGYGNNSTIWTADPWKLNPPKKITSIDLPSPEQKAKFAAIYKKTELNEFAKQFASKLTVGQSARLKAGKLSSLEMREIAMLVAAHEIGGEFERIVRAESMAIAFSSWQCNSRAYDKAFDALPKEQSDRYWNLATDYYLQTAIRIMDIGSSPSGYDSHPIWSPDGKKIAFIHKDHFDDSLYVTNTSGGGRKLLFTSAGIDSIVWTPDSKGLLFQSRRLTYLENKKEAGGSNMNQYSPGYPEIWYVEPKED